MKYKKRDNLNLKLYVCAIRVLKSCHDNVLLTVLLKYLYFCNRKDEFNVLKLVPKPATVNVHALLQLTRNTIPMGYPTQNNTQPHLLHFILFRLVFLFFYFLFYHL